MIRIALVTLAALPLAGFAQKGPVSAMNANLNKLSRMSGTAVVNQLGKVPLTVRFALAKPNRFEIKGAGLDCRYDGTRRYKLASGKWVPAGKDPNLPITLASLASFYGKTWPTSTPTKLAGISGSGYKLQSGLVVYIDGKSMPLKQVVTDKKGTRTLVAFKNLRTPNSKPEVVASNTAKPALTPVGRAASPGVVLTTGEAAVTLKTIGDEPKPVKEATIEKPVPPVKSGGGEVQAGPEFAAKLPMVGATIKNFNAPTPTGTMVDLAALNQKMSGSLIVFWHVSCPASGEYIPSLMKQRPRLQNLKVALVGVNCGDSAKETQAFLTKKKLNFLTVVNPDEEDLANRYGIAAFPTTIAIDKAGKVLGTFIGTDASGIDALLKCFG